MLPYKSAANPACKAAVKIRMGDLAPATRRIAGKLIDSQPGTGENRIWNLVHRVNVPVTEARLNLQAPHHPEGLFYDLRSERHVRDRWNPGRNVRAPYRGRQKRQGLRAG